MPSDYAVSYDWLMFRAKQVRAKLRKLGIPEGSSKYGKLWQRWVKK